MVFLKKLLNALNYLYIIPLKGKNYPRLDSDILQIIFPESKFQGLTFRFEQDINFPLDNSNKELKDYFYNQKFSIHSINLLNSEGKIIYSFEVDLSELKLLDTSLKNIKIYTYPFLFIEFTHGFYTTKELYLNN